MDYRKMIPMATGGFVARKSFSEYQFFAVLGLGYHLLFPKPSDYPIN